MIMHEYTRYSYTFDEEDRQAVKEWLRANNLKLKDIHKPLGMSYIHLCRITTGVRTASSLTVNKMRRMGIKLKKPSQNHQQ